MAPMRTSAEAPMWTFAVAALVSGILFIVVMPPFAAPDEWSHFIRAWNVSKGHLGAVRQGADVGSYVPGDLPPTLAPTILNPVANPELIRRALHTPPHNVADVFVPNSLHSWAAPVSYIPQAVGIALGRAAGSPYLVDFYLGRFVNLVASIALIMAAVRLFPSYRWLVVLIALTPMSTHLRASMSSDALTNGIAFLFIAFVARACFTDENLTPARWFAITLLAALLCLTRITYLPVAILPLAVPASRFGGAASAWRSRIVLSMVVLAAAIGSSRIATYYWAPYRADVTAPRDQLTFIFGHPAAFLHVLCFEHVVHAKWYLISMIGDLGSGLWSLPLPKLVVLIYWAIFVAFLIADTNRDVRVTPFQRFFFAFLCAGATFAVALALYLTWNLVGADHIDGLQGRYYIPFIPAAAFIVHRRADGLPQRWRIGITIAAVAVTTCIAAHAAVLKWYPAGWHDVRSIAGNSSPVSR